MSIQKRLRALCTNRSRPDQSKLVGYYRGARVTWSRRTDGEIFLTVRWPNGASWQVGPCGRHSRAGEVLVRRKGDVMSFLQKVDVRMAEGPHSVFIAEGLLKDLPAIVEYLSMETWPDGTDRERSSLLVIVESRMIKVCLTDRANSRSLWRANVSLEECLLGIEAALQNNDGDWRKSAPKESYGGKRKK